MLIKQICDFKDRNYHWLKTRIILRKWREFTRQQIASLRAVVRGVDITLKMEALRKIKEFNRNHFVKEREHQIMHKFKHSLHMY